MPFGHQALPAVASGNSRLSYPYGVLPLSAQGAPVDLAGEVANIEELVREWQSLLPQAAARGEHWLRILSQVKAHLAEDVVRVAVVGAVKSGKSTLINALVGRDLLKRGAGILTAMVTRVKPGPEARAVLRFKDWQTIGADIRQALALLPDARLTGHPDAFDLTRQEDRELLRQVLASGQAASWWADGSLNPNFALLSAYLAGYEKIQAMRGGGDTLELTGPELDRHQDLVTREELAVYLADASLSVPAPDLPPWVELGDCQGSDSPLPQHLTQVLSYLLSCDLALYVISSRVGLRQADFRFLQELRRMGLGDHLLFVLNLDLTDHRTAADCEAVTARVRQELAALMAARPLTAFSALEVLLKRRQAAASLEADEVALLALWGTEPAKEALSDAGWQQFISTLQDSLGAVKARRQAGGSLTQARMVAFGLREQVNAALALLRADAGAFRELADKLRSRQQPLASVRASLGQALEGAGQQLKKALAKRVGSFLEQQGGKNGFLANFVANFEPDWERLLAAGPAEPLRLKLYRLFQEFQQELLKLAGSEFNLQAVEFVHRQEEWLRAELQRTCAPLVLALEETLTLYYRETAVLGLHGRTPSLRLELPERSARLQMPLLCLTLEPGLKWTGEVWLRTGLGFLERAWLRVRAGLGLKGVDPRQQEEREMKRALAAIRTWMREELRVQLLNFGENLKFRYLFPLVDEFGQELTQSLDGQLAGLLTDLESLAAALSQGEADREERRRVLNALGSRVETVEARLAALIQAGAAQRPVASQAAV